MNRDDLGMTTARLQELMSDGKGHIVRDSKRSRASRRQTLLAESRKVPTAEVNHLKCDMVCRCESPYLCVAHMQPANFNAVECLSTQTRHEHVPTTVETHPPSPFPTPRRMRRRPLDQSRPTPELEEWAAQKGIELGPLVPDEQREEVLQTLWTYRDLESTGMSDMGPATDLITHFTKVKEGTPIHKAKARRYAPDKEWWLRKMVLEGLKAGMYEYTTAANGRLSQWGADPVLVKKDGKDEPRLTFNYHYVWEEPPGNQMELSSRAHAFLSLPSHQVFSSLDVKNAYWTVEIHPADRHVLAFSVPGIGQVQPTRMAQGARSSSFTMNQLGNIAFGAIPPPQPEPSFLHNDQGPENPPDMTFYVDDMFPAHDSWQKHWNFLRYHLFPRLEWARLKLSFSKIKIGMDQILALGEVHIAGGAKCPKPERVKKILEWPEPQNQTDVRSFLGSVILTRQWIKNYGEIARPLQRLTGKVEWQWGDAERTSFIILKHKCAAATLMFGWDPALPSEMFSDASKNGGGCLIRQLQKGIWVPILYDAFTFTPSEKNYDTYKRELRAIVYFATKHAHMLSGSKTSTIWTDHKPLTGFLNSDTHEDIFARWLEKLRPLNIKLKHILGKRNVAADGLSRTIFDAECTSCDDLTKSLASEVQKRHDAGDHEWFWKSGKGGYEDMLKELSEKAKQELIDKQTEDVEANSICTGFTSFGIPEDSEGTPEPTCHMVMTDDGSIHCGECAIMYEDGETCEEHMEAHVAMTTAAPGVPGEQELPPCANEYCTSGLPATRRVKRRSRSGDRICFNCYKRLERERNKASAENREVSESWKVGGWTPPTGMCTVPGCGHVFGRKGKAKYDPSGNRICLKCVRRLERETNRAREEGRDVSEVWKSKRGGGQRKESTNQRPEGSEASSTTVEEGLDPDNSGGITTSPGAPSFTQFLGRPADCEARHGQCDKSLCPHLCCRCQVWTMDMATTEWNRVPDIPLNVLTSPTECNKHHEGCDKATCQHSCCRVRHYDCVKSHATCDRSTCDHPCCKIWVAWKFRGKMPPPPLATKAAQARRAAAPANLQRIDRAVQNIKGLATGRVVDKSVMTRELYELKDALQSITGQEYHLNLQDPGKASDEIGEAFIMPSIGGITPLPFETGYEENQLLIYDKSGSGSKPTTSSSHEEENVDPQLEDGAELGVDEEVRRASDEEELLQLETVSPLTTENLHDTEMLDDSAPMYDYPDPSESSSVGPYPALTGWRHSATGNAITTESSRTMEQLHEEWYGDLTRYYQRQDIPQDWTKRQLQSFKRRAKWFRYNADKQRLEREAAQGRWVACVHPKDVPEVLRATHDKAGHFSSEVVANKLRGRLWWPTMARDIWDYVKSCTNCAVWAQRRHTEPIMSLDALHPWEVVQADLITPLPETARGNKHLLVMVCPFSNFAVTRPLKDKSGPLVISAMKEVFNTLATPSVVMTDPGKEFLSIETATMLQDRGIFLYTAPSGAHRPTGAVESLNRILRRVMEKTSPIYKNAQGHLYTKLEDWDLAMSDAAQTANQRHIPRMGCSPMEVIFGYAPDELGSLQPLYPSERREQVVNFVTSGSLSEGNDGDMQMACLRWMAEREDLRDQVRANQTRERGARERVANRGVQQVKIHVGDVVISRRPETRLKKSLDSPWEGPMRVVAPAGEHGKSWILERIDTSRRLAHPRHGHDLRVIHRRPRRLRPTDEAEGGMAEGGHVAAVE